MRSTGIWRILMDKELQKKKPEQKETKAAKAEAKPEKAEKPVEAKKDTIK